MGRTAWSDRAREESDRALFARFLALPELMQARTVLLYHGMGAEPDTAQLLSPLWALGKTVALPRCLPGGEMEARRVEPGSALVRHTYGMLEPGEDCPPVERGILELILVPGLCFDRGGYRLGRGGGYYDRYLAAFSGYTVGLCREEELFPAVPRQAHDRPVKVVVTERETLRPVPWEADEKRTPKGPLPPG